MLADLEKHQPEKYLKDNKDSRIKQEDLATLTEGDMVKVSRSPPVLQSYPPPPLSMLCKVSEHLDRHVSLDKLHSMPIEWTRG